jgi:hypothetical protein
LSRRCHNLRDTLCVTAAYRETVRAGEVYFSETPRDALKQAEARGF